MNNFKKNILTTLIILNLVCLLLFTLLFLDVYNKIIPDGVDNYLIVFFLKNRLPEIIKFFYPVLFIFSLSSSIFLKWKLKKENQNMLVNILLIELAVPVIIFISLSLYIHQNQYYY